MQKQYKEMRVIDYTGNHPGNYKIVRMIETDRKVKIHEWEAELMNGTTWQTDVHYELDEVTVDEMTKAQLIEYANENDIEIDERKTKAEIVATIKDA